MDWRVSRTYQTVYWLVALRMARTGEHDAHAEVVSTDPPRFSVSAAVLECMQVAAWWVGWLSGLLPGVAIGLGLASVVLALAGD